MRIGLTYDLRADYLAEGYGEEETAEFDRPDTIDGIEGALRSLGHQTDRIGHARSLIQRLAAGDRWELVFNICEGMYGLGREAQVPAILDVYNISYTFADPVTLCVCLHKGLTKTVVQRAGVPTPKFLVVEQLADIQRIDFGFPMFAKPLAEGTGKGVGPTSRVTDRQGLEAACQRLLAQFRQPVLVEEYLSGREFTVGLLGTGTEAKVLGTLEVLLLPAAEQGAYSYVNKERSEELVDYRLIRGSEDDEVRRAEEIALAAWRALGGRDGGRLDIRSGGKGDPQFIEANPLAGLHPQHSDLPMIARAVGMSFTELIGRIVESASRRIGVVSGER
jgi:D-alanine-D-alanine ligase